MRRVARYPGAQIIRQVHQKERCAIGSLHLAYREAVSEQSDGKSVFPA